MTRTKIWLLAASVTAVVGGSPAQAEIFGGFDVGRTRDANFNAAPEDQVRVAESITTSAAHVGAFWPSANQRSALILKGDVAAARMGQFKTLDNDTYGLSFGGYYAFSPKHSVLGMLGTHRQRYDESDRNMDIYTAQVGFKQALSTSFWLREGLLLEKGNGRVQSNDYSGYALSGSLNWSPFRSTVLSLGFARNQRVHDVETANRRTGNQVNLGVVQELGRVFYVRAGVSRQTNKTNAGNRYDTALYNVGLGASF